MGILQVLNDEYVCLNTRTVAARLMSDTRDRMTIPQMRQHFQESVGNYVIKVLVCFGIGHGFHHVMFR